MEKKNKERLKIVLSAYDVLTLEEATKMLVDKLLQIKVDFINPIPLPVKREFFSLLTAPTRFKAAQEQFEKIIHRRVAFINKPTKQDIEAISKVRFPNTVDIRWINQ